MLASLIKRTLLDRKVGSRIWLFEKFAKMMLETMSLGGFDRMIFLVTFGSQYCGLDAYRD